MENKTPDQQILEISEKNCFRNKFSADVRSNRRKHKSKSKVKKTYRSLSNSFVESNQRLSHAFKPFNANQNQKEVTLPHFKHMKACAKVQARKIDAATINYGRAFTSNSDVKSLVEDLTAICQIHDICDVIKSHLNFRGRFWTDCHLLSEFTIEIIPEDNISTSLSSLIHGNHIVLMSKMHGNLLAFNELKSLILNEFMNRNHVVYTMISSSKNQHNLSVCRCLTWGGYEPLKQRVSHDDDNDDANDDNNSNDDDADDEDIKNDANDNNVACNNDNHKHFDVIIFEDVFDFDCDFDISYNACDYLNELLEILEDGFANEIDDAIPIFIHECFKNAHLLSNLPNLIARLMTLILSSYDSNIVRCCLLSLSYGIKQNECMSHEAKLINVISDLQILRSKWLYTRPHPIIENECIQFSNEIVSKIDDILSILCRI